MNHGTKIPNWKLRTQALEFGTLPALMGIVNVTPDSFSDGGRHASTAAAIDHASKLAADGADILDIGGESTRPYAVPVTVDEELRRVIPVVQALAEKCNVPISIDTSKAAVAREAIAAGAEIINDVTGLEGDRGMLALAVESGAGVCAMHMQGNPRTMQDDPQYGNVVEEIYDYLHERREALLAAGIERERICLDPGIGFGKTHEHNLELASHCSRFLDLGQPLLVGHSRKGFIAHVMGDKESDRTAGTIGVSLALARQGVQVLRVHNVAETRHALQLFNAVGGLRD